MTKVFIGGSRRISKLNRSIRARLDRIMDGGFMILIGDANGADRSIQDYLSLKHYGNVLVFCMENKCRNNIGNWQHRSVKTNTNNKSFHYYAAKDLEMAREADYGFMLWDSKSKGTLNNIFNLIKENKKTLVYFSPEKNYYQVSTLDDLRILLSKCDRQSLEILGNDLKVFEMPGKTANGISKLTKKHEQPMQPALWAAQEFSPSYVRESGTSRKPATEVQSVRTRRGLQSIEK